MPFLVKIPISPINPATARLIDCVRQNTWLVSKLCKYLVYAPRLKPKKNSSSPGVQLFAMKLNASLTFSPRPKKQSVAAVAHRLACVQNTRGEKHHLHHWYHHRCGPRFRPNCRHPYGNRQSAWYHPNSVVGSPLKAGLHYSDYLNLTWVFHCQSSTMYLGMVSLQARNK